LIKVRDNNLSQNSLNMYRFLCERKMPKRWRCNFIFSCTSLSIIFTRTSGWKSLLILNLNNTSLIIWKGGGLFYPNHLNFYSIMLWLMFKSRKIIQFSNSCLLVNGLWNWEREWLIFCKNYIHQAKFHP